MPICVAEPHATQHIPLRQRRLDQWTD